MRMREALRDALAEEMRRDESVFVMGEDVGVFQGAFKVTEGLLDEFGAATSSAQAGAAQYSRSRSGASRPCGSGAHNDGTPASQVRRAGVLQ